MTEFKDVAHLYLGCEWEWKQYAGHVTDGIYRTDFFNSKLLREIELGNGVAKPIIRKLSDMTEEEKIMLCCLNVGNGWQPGHIIETNDDDIAAMRVFDHKGNYKSLYISKNKISPFNFLWLLKQGFDLFGLIESGQAISLHNPSTPSNDTGN